MQNSALGRKTQLVLVCPYLYHNRIFLFLDWIQVSSCLNCISITKLITETASIPLLPIGMYVIVLTINFNQNICYGKPYFPIRLRSFLT